MNEHGDHRGGRRGLTALRPSDQPRGQGRGRRRPPISDGRTARFRPDAPGRRPLGAADRPPRRAGPRLRLIQVLEAKTDGRWKPSPGSVYPALQMLTDEGLVTFTEADGKRTFELTDAGREQANEHVETRGYPWDAMDRGRSEGRSGFRTALRDFHLAAKQVGDDGLGRDRRPRPPRSSPRPARTCTGSSPSSKTTHDPGDAQRAWGSASDHVTGSLRSASSKFSRREVA